MAILQKRKTTATRGDVTRSLDSAFQRPSARLAARVAATPASLTSTTRPTLTTRTSGASRPTSVLKPRASTSNAAANALLGAALGLGAKFAFDSKGNVTKQPATQPVAQPATKPVAPVVRPPVTPSAPVTPSRPAAPVATPATKPAETPVQPSPAGLPLNAEKQEDGTYIVRNDDGSLDYYGKNGNYMSSSYPVPNQEPVQGTELTDTVTPKTVAQPDQSDIASQVPATEEMYYTDRDGNIYNAFGELVFDANASESSQPSAQEQQSTFWDEEFSQAAPTPSADYSGDWGDYKDGGAVIMKDGGYADGGGVEYFDDGSYIQYFDDGSSVTYDQNGDVYSSTGAYQTTYDDYGNAVVTDDYGNIVNVYDPSGAIIPAGGGREDITQNVTLPKPRVTTPAPTGGLGGESGGLQAAQKWLQSNIIDPISSSGYLGAGAAGALLGGLLGNTSLLGGGGQQAPSVDMAAVSRIPERTTDFGIGPARVVPYSQYAQPNLATDIYGDELYQNLNVPGANPVNEPEQPAMARGGLAGVQQTHYTFGNPVNPLDNLQVKDGGGMKHGGLPALSNVPLREGRLDFRQGSAVHGPGDGQSDDIPAMLADGEYVFDADTVAALGNGSTKAGAKALDKMREQIREHKRSAPINKIPPPAKSPLAYLKG